MTAAETLRTAARLMRSNAEGALLPRDTWFRPQFLAERTDDLVTVADGVHIASWHPAVALAVADWLDMEANKWDQNYTATQRPSPGIDQPPAIHYGNPEAAAANADWHAGNALAVAHAYLNTQDTP